MWEFCLTGLCVSLTGIDARERCHFKCSPLSSLGADPESLAFSGSGLLAADGEHRCPGGHPHALLHHRPLLLRRLQTRDTARQPYPGKLSEQVVNTDTAPCPRVIPTRPIPCFPGSAGLLRGSHLRTLSQPRTVCPHQLDRPRWQRVVLFLQCLTGLVTCHDSTDWDVPLGHTTPLTQPSAPQPPAQTFQNKVSQGTPEKVGRSLLVT